jgi:hypothetical protein
MILYIKRKEKGVLNGLRDATIRWAMPKKKGRSMKAVGYKRVSTGRQELEGVSLEMQDQWKIKILLIRAWLK